MSQEEYAQYLEKNADKIARSTPEYGHNAVNKPSHYHTGNIDVIKFSEENFSNEELKEAVSYAHTHGKKVYVANHKPHF